MEMLNLSLPPVDGVPQPACVRQTGGSGWPQGRSIHKASRRSARPLSQRLSPVKMCSRVLQGTPSAYTWPPELPGTITIIPSPWGMDVPGGTEEYRFLLHSYAGDLSDFRKRGVCRTALEALQLQQFKQTYAVLVLENDSTNFCKGEGEYGKRNEHGFFMNEGNLRTTGNVTTSGSRGGSR